LAEAVKTPYYLLVHRSHVMRLERAAMNLSVNACAKKDAKSDMI
jgi:hypothetical protein